jgi:hypothetical protein
MNGYIKINIAEVEVGLKFSYLSNKLFIEANFDRPGAYIEKSGAFTDLGWAKLLHCAYRVNCDIKETPVKLTVADFFDWIEGLNSNTEGGLQFTQAVSVWKDSEATQQLVNKVNALTVPEEGKKRKKKEVDPTGTK